MIYQNKNLAVTGPPSQEKPYTIEMLMRLVENNDEGSITEVIIEKIEKHKFPYEYVPDKDGKYRLKSILCQGEQFLERFITEDIETLAMKKDCLKMMRCPNEVLVVGDTGTGKELIAQSMIGERKGNIRTVNCAGLPSELIESELFGYVQGAFTGANKSKAGLMTMAKDGVMFLDEIGELPLSVQGKLLRALQEKKIRMVGGHDELEINCKFVCATNRDLIDMVTKGLFRRDLYARISTLELCLKSLKERECDIIPITESLQGGKVFADKYREPLLDGRLDLNNNVRSIQQHVIRYNVLGRVTFKK